MKRAKHSLSNYKLATLNMGKLVPIGCYEALPGDTVQQVTSMLLRVSPLLAPVMHPVTVRIHHWFVPYRIIWEDWENFITGGPDGMNASDFPYIDDTTSFALGSTGDYFGLPTGVTLSGANRVSALPFRALNKIFNEFYRDQDLVAERAISLASGEDTTTDLSLPTVAWEKDYFTSARPWTQKGPQITIPLGTTAPVELDGYTGTQLVRTQGTGVLPGAGALGNSAAGVLEHTGTGTDMLLDPNGTMVANLASASAADINDLREAFALQRYEEARARYGSRYTEYLRYLGVRSSDARLQRPEYLGGGKQVIQFSEVLQTARNDSASIGVGNMLGHGISAARSRRYRRFFEEHGVVISLLSVLPKTMYFEGIPRWWSRRTKEDFWQRELEHIGQQEVYNRELYAAGAAPGDVFGYQDRYDEYRRIENSIAGEFRSTLNYWHMARDFAAAPTLNGSFVSADPTNRIYQSTATDQLYVMAHHSIQARRLVGRTGKSFIY